MKRFIVLLSMCGMLFLAGCGGNMLAKSCDSLTDISRDLSDIYIQAQAISIADPNAISVDMLEIIKEMQDITASVAGTTCSLKDTVDLLD